MTRGYSPERREDDMFGTDFERADRKHDPFDPASRALAFKLSGTREKAKKLLEAIDDACLRLDIAPPCGSAGVTFVGELSASAMLRLRWAAKLAKPPSHECFAELFRLIRERA